MTGNHVRGKLLRGFESPSLRHFGWSRPRLRSACTSAAFRLWVLLAAAPVANGQTPGPEFQINVTTTDMQESSAVAAHADGRFVVVWLHRGDLSAGGWNVVGRRFGPTGPLTDEFLVTEWTTGGQLSGAVAMDPDGNFMVVWYDYDGRDGDRYGVFGQRFDASGARVGPEFLVNG